MIEDSLPRFTQVLHLDVLCPGTSREGLNRAVVDPYILVSYVPHGNTSIHRRGPQELYPLPVMVGEGHSILWVENGYRMLFRHFGPGHHAEVAAPGAHTVEDHPFLEIDNGNLGRAWIERIFMVHRNVEQIEKTRLIKKVFDLRKPINHHQCCILYR